MPKKDATVYIIDVSPISAIGLRENLSYFSKEKPVIGSLVYAPIRKQEVLSVVTNIKSPTEHKSELRSASFSIKKGDFSNWYQIADQRIFSAVEKISQIHCSSVGSVMNNLIPNFVFEDPETFTFTPQKEPLVEGISV